MNFVRICKVFNTQLGIMLYFGNNFKLTIQIPQKTIFQHRVFTNINLRLLLILSSKFQNAFLSRTFKLHDTSACSNPHFGSCFPEDVKAQFWRKWIRVNFVVTVNIVSLSFPPGIIIFQTSFASPRPFCNCIDYFNLISENLIYSYIGL